METFKVGKFGLNITRFLRFFLSAIYLLHYFFNFMSSPLAIYSILLITIFTFIAVVAAENEFSIIALICFAFVEGQGRVLWGYNPFFRIVFDLYSLLFILKVAGQNKRYIMKEKIHSLTYIAFILHIFWFTLNLFNPSGAGFFYAFAAAKYYVFPILLFFSFLSFDQFKEVAFLQRIGFYVVSLTVLTSALCFYQMSEGEKSVIGISLNYTQLFEKYKVFTEAFFRPWGTSFVAGGMSVILFLTLGFVFLFFSMKGRVYNVFIFLIVVTSSWFTLFICQVRSAMMKHVFIFVALCFTYVLTARHRARYMSLAIIGSVCLFFIFQSFIDKFSLLEKSMNLDYTVRRYESLITGKKSKKNEREGFTVVSNRIFNDTSWPFGFGPGMLTSFIPEYEQRRAELTTVDPVRFWASDNLFLFLFLEMGIGAIFYIVMTISVPLVVIYNLIHNFKSISHVHRRLSLMSVIIMLVIYSGNWGAIGLCFNPESFFFWLWAAIGIRSSELPEK
jgi:hypothetical protein